MKNLGTETGRAVSSTASIHNVDNVDDAKLEVSSQSKIFKIKNKFTPYFYNIYVQRLSTRMSNICKEFVVMALVAFTYAALTNE